MLTSDFGRCTELPPLTPTLVLRLNKVKLSCVLLYCISFSIVSPCAAKFTAVLDILYREAHLHHQPSWWNQIILLYSTPKQHCIFFWNLPPSIVWKRKCLRNHISEINTLIFVLDTTQSPCWAPYTRITFQRKKYSMSISDSCKIRLIDNNIVTALGANSKQLRKLSIRLTCCYNISKLDW